MRAVRQLAPDDGVTRRTFRAVVGLFDSRVVTEVPELVEPLKQIPAQGCGGGVRESLPVFPGFPWRVEEREYVALPLRPLDLSLAITVVVRAWPKTKEMPLRSTATLIDSIVDVIGTVL